MLSLGVSANPVTYTPINNPVDINVDYPLIVRAPSSAKTPSVVPTKTKRYNATVAAAGKDGKTLEPNKWYVFTKEWDLPDAVEGTFESKTDLQKLQEKLGFEHVAVIIGQVTEVRKGKGKNEEITMDFGSYYMDLMKDPGKISSVLRGPERPHTKEPIKPKQTLIWSKATTVAKGSVLAMGEAGKA